MSQSHFTLRFPLKSSADAKAVAQELPPLMPDLFRAEDAIGTVHYSRFTVLSDRTLLFLGDFDGDFGPLMRELGRSTGQVFDKIFKHVSDPPPTPVASNPDAFTEWARNICSVPPMSSAPIPARQSRRSRRWLPPPASRAGRNCFRSW